MQFVLTSKNPDQVLCSPSEPPGSKEMDEEVKLLTSCRRSALVLEILRGLPTVS